MTTKHTDPAVELYRQIESTLNTLTRLLEQTGLVQADEWTVATLRCVARDLNKVEDAWVAANRLADTNRVRDDGMIVQDEEDGR